MTAALAAPIMAGAMFILPSCGENAAPTLGDTDGPVLSLKDSFYAMRDARICAGLDPRTDVDAMAREESRTEEILEFGRRNGVGPAIDAVEQRWIETQGYFDKICPFQMVGELDETTPSLDLYRAANDALEAAIAAEAK